jgi:hypothetical protein
MESMTRFITRRLRLKVNEAMSNKWFAEQGLIPLVIPR